MLLVSPEQRLSLELKWKEYLLRQRQAAGAGDAQQATEVAALLTALFKVPLLNILDESDELLHHRCGRVCHHLCLPRCGCLLPHRSNP